MDTWQLLSVLFFLVVLFYYTRSAQAHYQKGEALLQRGEIKRGSEEILIAAERNYLPAIHRVGILCAKANDIYDAVKWLKMAADKDYTDSQEYLGNMFLEGEKVDADYTKAIHWLQIAANKNNHKAWMGMAKAYLDGHGVVQNTAQGIECLKKAAALGNFEAYETIAQVYQNQKNETEAFIWYKKAAIQGDIHCIIKVGDMLKAGMGVAKNDVEALNWYNIAANNGNKNAMYILSKMYQDGVGTHKDPEKATEWMNKAAR